MKRLGMEIWVPPNPSLLATVVWARRERKARLGGQRAEHPSRRNYACPSGSGHIRSWVSSFPYGALLNPTKVAGFTHEVPSFQFCKYLNEIDTGALD